MKLTHDSFVINNDMLPVIPTPHWFAKNESKRWAESFYLVYSIFWISLITIIVEFRYWSRMEEMEYLTVGLLIFVPEIILPLLFPADCDKGRPWHQRHVFKASMWIAIYSYIGNFYYTHFFYNVLGAEYTFKAHRLNDVPICLYMITHAYFTLYHSAVNLLLRRFWSSQFFNSVSPTYQSKDGTHFKTTISTYIGYFFSFLIIFALSWLTAIGETVTIANFPHYKFENRNAMYTIGVTLYALYFVVSFPVFFLVDEHKEYSMRRVIVESLASCMAIFCTLDWWRLTVGTYDLGLSNGQTLPPVPYAQPI